MAQREDASGSQAGSIAVKTTSPLALVGIDHFQGADRGQENTRTPTNGRKLLHLLLGSAGKSPSANHHDTNVYLSAAF